MAAWRAKTSDVSPSGPDRPPRGAARVGGFARGECLPKRAAAVWQSKPPLRRVMSAYRLPLTSLAVCSGRAVSDKIGRRDVLLCGCMGAAVKRFSLAKASAVVGFALGITGIGVSFGPAMGVLPSIVTEQFGARHFGLNYEIMFTGYSIAAVFGQRTAASIAATNNGDFSKPFYIAIDGWVIGATLLLIFK
jgi:OFA family oxalate/formate antiporter-like MFS transporter